MQEVHETNKSLLMASSSTMEKQDLLQQQTQAAAALRCPRCDSANTKFCYYNNYSLSQPRHFCKACKRYWTRGGTLRNVPVGGGCRKNKRLKRPSPSSIINPPPPLPTSSAADLHNPTHHHRQFQLIDQINPLFYKQQSNTTNNPPPPPPYGFSYPAGAATFFGGGGESPSNNNNNNSAAAAAGDAILSPTMATLLASTLNNKFSSSTSNGVVKRPDSAEQQHFQAMAAFDGLQMKTENQQQNQQGQEWNFNTFTNSGQQYHHPAAGVEQQVGSDPQSVYWNALWHDPGNIGPSVTSLI